MINLGEPQVINVNNREYFVRLNKLKEFLEIYGEQALSGIKDKGLAEFYKERAARLNGEEIYACEIEGNGGSFLVIIYSDRKWDIKGNFYNVSGKNGQFANKNIVVRDIIKIDISDIVKRVL